MFDLLMLGLGAVAFATCAGYVAWCDRIIGPDPQNAAVDEISTVLPTDNDPTAYNATPMRKRGEVMTYVLAVAAIDNWIGLGLAVGVAIYLILVLLFPERF